MRKNKQRRRGTSRIYYGQFKNGKQSAYWTVKVRDATEKVVVNGTLKDALLGTAGSTIGCHLSNCAMENDTAFPHPVVLASFTRSRCFIITKVKNGQPCNAVRYAHNYDDYVDLNDKDEEKKFVRKYPELVERPFVLYPPPVSQTHERGGQPRRFTGERVSRVQRGALQRAISAGLISPGLKSALV